MRKSIFILAISLLLPIVCCAQESIQSLKNKAQRGDAVAQYNLGVYYDNGEGVAQDYQQAVYWFRKAAEQGLAKAQLFLGVRYYSGKGVAQDYQQAVYWFRKAAEQGNANAQYWLGACYADGEGVAQDSKLAAYWYRKAAEQGNADAQYWLGVYYSGEGVAKDLKQAAYWYRKAAEQGNYFAKVFLEEIEKEIQSSSSSSQAKSSTSSSSSGQVHDVAEQMPEFPGGQSALIQFLSQNIQYPEICEKKGIQGRVICSCVVDTDGSITDVQVKQSVDPNLDREAVRVIQSMPKWTPGKENGLPVRVRYTIPITFRLQ